MFTSGSYLEDRYHRRYKSLNIVCVCMCFLGDIQVGMMDKKGQLEVEIIRARGLVVKPGSKTLPGKVEKS